MMRRTSKVPQIGDPRHQDIPRTQNDTADRDHQPGSHPVADPAGEDAENTAKDQV